MKNLCFIGWLRATLLAAVLLFAIPAAWAHGMGGAGGFHGSGGFHSSGSHNFAFHHGGDRFFHRHDGDHFFHRHDRFFFGFGYPFYGYPDYYYPYDYGYYDYSGAPSDDQYWSDLTAAVQTELARDGYYHGAIDGVVSSDTLRAIRAYRKAKGLPVNTQIDRRLLRSLDI
jgi:hypothetical protein